MPPPNDLPLGVEPLLDGVQSELSSILGRDLVGLYLYGSLVTGNFDLGASDVDLLVVTSAAIDDDTFARLDEMHRRAGERHPAWVDRLEIAYVPLKALRTFRTATSIIAVISPGEPFHRKEAGNDWLINWHVVRSQGRSLFGPEAADMIAPISREEYVQAVRAQASEWREWVLHIESRPAQAYSILTLCRALYAVHHGEQASKLKASLWAEGVLPEWAAVIEEARRWREAWREDGLDAAATMPTTIRFVHDVIVRIEGQ